MHSSGGPGGEEGGGRGEGGNYIRMLPPGKFLNFQFINGFKAHHPAPPELNNISPGAAKFLPEKNICL